MPVEKVTLELKLQITYVKYSKIGEAEGIGLTRQLSRNLCQHIGQGMLGKNYNISVDDWNYTITPIDGITL